MSEINISTPLWALTVKEKKVFHWPRETRTKEQDI